MRFVVAAVLLLGLAGCGAGAGARTLELQGSVTQVMASGGEAIYVLDVAGEGMLPLELGGSRPPLGATGVVVVVPDGLEIPGDDAGRFEALSAWTVAQGEGLTVVGFLS